MRLVIPIRLSTRNGSGEGEVKNHIASETGIFLRSLGDKAFKNTQTVESRTSSIIPINSPRMINSVGLIDKIGADLRENSACQELLIDVGGPNFDLSPHVQLIMALSDVAEWFSSNHAEKRLMITLPDYIDEDSEFFFKIQNLQTKAITYNYSKNTTSNPDATSTLSGEDHETLRALLANARKSNKERLSKLVVCHLGKFFVQHSNAVIFDYYEADHASDQIYFEFKKIVEEKLLSRKPSARTLNVLYDDRGSLWFSTAVRNALKLLSEEAQFLGVSELNTEIGRNEFDLVFLPIVRTGSRIAEIFHSHPNLINPDRTDIWSLVKIGSDALQETFDIGAGRSVLVNSILSLGSRGEQVRKLWGESLDLDPVPVSEIDLPGKLSSESMYSMIYEAGIKDETEIPVARRTGLGFVMDSKRMLELNAPLFASKIRNALTLNLGEVLASNVTFLHPDENAANILASAVNELSSNDSIRVRSELIYIAANSTSVQNLSENAKSHSQELAEYCDNLISFLLRLKTNDNLSTTSQLKIVLLYEFNAQGGTLEGMKRLAHLVGFDVVSSVALANMIPTVEANSKPDISFYDFGYKSA